MNFNPATVDQNNLIESRIDALLTQMTLGEKIGQMTQVSKTSITPEEVAALGIGSVLSGGGGNPTPNTPEDWRAMVQSFLEAALKSRLGIPLIYGSDAVHGHNNAKGTVIFPHNIGLGAAGDPDLVARAAYVVATEMLATGVHWDFAPAVSIPRDIRWGRTYEGYSTDPQLVTELGAAFVRGLQAASPEGTLRALASVKHYVGDGGTTWGTTQKHSWIPHMWNSPDEKWSIDQGLTEVDEDELRAVHLVPYIAAIREGALNIMVSYSSWGGLKMHEHHYLLTDVLKNELGFKGFLVSDWMAINQLSEAYYDCVVRSINAGLDMIMVPFDYREFIDTLTRAVEKGDVSQERIDDAVRRILLAKFKLGLFEDPLPDTALLQQVGSSAHREIAREAVRKSLVLLKNEQHTLPVAKDVPVLLVGGRAAHDIGIQSGGWTIEWQGGTGAITTGTTILEGIRAAVSTSTQVHYDLTGAFANENTKAPVGIAVVGELPYAEGEGDKLNLALSEDDVDTIHTMRAKCEHLIVVLVCGRPVIITEQLPLADAVVAAWLPGSEGQGVADVLFGDYPFTGKLPHPYPRSMAQVPYAALKQHNETPLWEMGFGLSI